MRRLLPDPADPVDPADLLAGLSLGERAPRERPYTLANFVASLDGRASLDGGSTGLGDAGDKAIFRALRGCADALLVGTGTLAAEHYGVLSRDPAVIALRARLGLPAQPPLVTIARHTAIPPIPLLDAPAARLIAYVGPGVAIPEHAAAMITVVRRAPEALTTAAVLADLRAHHGVRLLLCEGGAALFSDLVAGGLCDELFLTVAARLAGGHGGAITRDGAPARPRDAGLLWVLEQDGSLYLRYALTP